MDLRLTCLSPVERDLVVGSALRILEHTGMRLNTPRALDALEARGAAVDRESGVVRMPEGVVRAALSSLPEELLIAGAAPGRDVVFDRRSGPRFNPSACIARTLDFRTGMLRPSSLQDLREGTTVMDATPELDLLWTFATANDVPPERRELTEYHTFLTHSSKPLVLVDPPTQVEAVKRMMDILGGGLDGFRRRPRLGLLCAVRAPLEVNPRLLETTCELAAMGMPIWVYTMPMAGATAPITIGGILALMWAEILGIVTAVQAAAPGVGVLACFGPGILDMRSGSMSLGNPESTLMGVASVEIAHSLRLPAHNSALSSDAKHPGLQAGYEKGLKALPAAAAGVDEISGGFGALDSSSVWHLPMVPIDAEIVRMVRRLVTGAEVTAETIMADVIERVGIGGNYLKERVTRERVRAGEHFAPTIGSRLPFEQWVAEGREETDVAREMIEQTLVATVGRRDASRLADEQLEALDEVCGVAG
ncbi:MAG TPA: trimethylamine methyltransferase family protein [Thermoleophilia bacterium]|nr:trimethylamine methyltransferase family protein [Thermoleophilia bacterium]